MNAPDGVLDLGNIPLNTIFVDRRVGRPKNSIEGSSSPNFDPTIRRESKDSVFTDVSMNNSRAGHKVVRRESIESIDEDGLLKTCSQCATTKTIRWRFGENQALVCNGNYIFGIFELG